MDRTVIKTSVQYRAMTFTAKDIWGVQFSVFYAKPGGDPFSHITNNLSSVKHVAKINLKHAVKLDETVAINVSHVSQGSQFADEG